MKISSIEVSKIRSSQGNETIEVSMSSNQHEVKVSVPAGISAGKYEVKKVSADVACEQINSLKSDLIGVDFSQEDLDKLLVSKNLGGNASIAVSVAFWKLQLMQSNFTPTKFPKMFLLVFEGAEHGNPNITIQEFALIENNLLQAKKDFELLKQKLEEQNIDTTIGAEGAFSPKSFTNEDVFNTISSVFPNDQIAIDAAGSFRDESVDFVKLITQHKIASIEDPYSDEDFEKWSKLCRQLPSNVMVVGDDLTVSNKERLQKAIDAGSINAMIIKPNQNGTVSGTLETVALAKKNNIKIIVSHRGDETNDDWIVDFALFVEADYVKFGGFAHEERVAKYNRLAELGMK